MGLFSGIGKAVGSVAKVAVPAAAAYFSGGSSLLGTLGSSAMSYLGGREANDANMDMFSSSQDFTREMMKNKYQWQVEDLKNAGLNPALAYGQAPSMGNSPSGNAQTDAVTPSVNTGMQKAMNDVLVSKTKADTTASLATAANQQSQADLNSATRAKVEAETPNVAMTGANIRADTQLKQMQYFVGTMEAQLKGSQNTLTEAQTRVAQQTIDNMKQQIAQMKAEIANRNSLTSMNTLQLPRLKNEAAAEGDWWKQNVSPYNKDISTMSSSANSALDMVGKLRGFSKQNGVFKLTDKQLYREQERRANLKN